MNLIINEIEKHIEVLEKLKSELKIELLIEEKLEKQKKNKDLLKCQYCGKHFINTKDKKTGKISKYLWIPNCECHKFKFKVSMG